jgi:hypothetical protein
VLRTPTSLLNTRSADPLSLLAPSHRGISF